jgi:2-polyprenyl-3-methyl-5-hydroxy-6-metoxy-1,4-benzoquinol methylase
MSSNELVHAVAAAYDRAAQAFHDARPILPRTLSRYLDDLLRPLEAGAAVLDVGCGSGRPVAKHLVERGFRVTGLDISHQLLELARRDVPAATFLLGAMRKLELLPRFQAIVAWDSVFHVPRRSTPPCSSASGDGSCRENAC